ncbi:hypothetical protein AGMMS4952_24820 [Spirochaetia bacterium]|nr:hypothetical protein AGMMS4952_24820 [Spirochaetia bacterium]
MYHSTGVGSRSSENGLMCNSGDAAGKVFFMTRLLLGSFFLYDV